MKRLRFWIITLVVWLIFFFNIERINAPIDIRSYTYIFAAIAIVAALVVPRLRGLPYLVLLFIPVPLFLWFKAIWSGDPILGKALPLTITQITAIVVTGLISVQISYSLREFEHLIHNITFGYIGKHPKGFDEAQESIYKELSRARRYHRPLSVVTLKLDPESVKVALPKLTEEVQRAMMQEYLLAGITRILSDTVSDFGTISLRNNHFIVVLPETTETEAPVVAQKLATAVQDAMNINLVTGSASFPHQAITFETLIEHAINDANQKGAEQSKQPLMALKHQLKIDKSGSNVYPQ